MLLFVDVEGSGLPIKGLPYEDPANPWPVQAAADLCDYDGRSVAHFDFRIKADGRKIDAGATAVHGITSREADKTGVPEVIALGALVGLVADAEKVIGFGIGYDRSVLVGALVRLGRDPRKLLRPGLEFADLIPAAAAACKIPSEHNSNTFRWPSLGKAAEILLPDYEIDDALHDAWGDCQLAKLVYFELKRRNLIEESPIGEPSPEVIHGVLNLARPETSPGIQGGSP